MPGGELESASLRKGNQNSHLNLPEAYGHFLSAAFRNLPQMGEICKLLLSVMAVLILFHFSQVCHLGQSQHTAHDGGST